MAIIARTNKPRPANRGLVVEVHDRPNIIGKSDLFDLVVILWSPAFGAHVHYLPGLKGKAHAIEVAEHIGQAHAQQTRKPRAKRR